MNREIEIAREPLRIVSLVPSITELLFDLGLEKKVVGVTKFCVFPSKARLLAKQIGGTKKLHLNRIFDLQPDLAIGNKEENNKEDIEALSGRVPVWMSDVRTVEQALQMIRQIGKIFSKEVASEALITKIEDGFRKLRNESEPSVKVAYLIWQNPYMVSGADNFINAVIHAAGWENCFENFAQAPNHRYPAVTVEDLQKAAPDVVLLSSEPYPFKTEHIQEFRQILPGAQIELVDGTLFSWYGSRMSRMCEYLIQLRRRWCI